jgi:2-amino-4-hydroxy-6-hydroxymethyldihydropteridine diphosphokinase
MSATVYIAVGANIDPEANVRRGLRRLAGQVRLRAVSTFYRTAAEGADGPDFINGVVAAETDLPPFDLKFVVLRAIEAELGRVRGADRNAPRPLDLDLLVYDDLTLVENGLTLPDPAIAARPFLALPLCELAPALVLPGERSLADICTAMSTATLEPLPALTRILREELAHERPAR